MRKQKFILKSKTLWCALLGLTIAIAPEIKAGLETDFHSISWWEIGAIALTTTGTVISRYIAKEELYTPHGIPGRDYISATHQIFESQTSRSQTDRRGEDRR